MSYINSDDSRKRDKERMGDDLGELYYVIKNEALNVQIKYQKYASLFGCKNIVKSLNKFASGFFGYIQEILFNDLILHISKLFDDPRIGGRKVLCFNCLLEKITDEKLKEQLEKILNECDKKRIFAKIRRNKYIAHNDYQLFLGEKEYDISINIDDIKEMIERMWSIIDCIELFYFNVYTVKYVYPTNLDFEKLFNNIKLFNTIGLKKITAICNDKE